MARRERLLAQSEELRGHCAGHLRALSGPMGALNRAAGLFGRLRRVPLGLLIGVTREGLGVALSTKERRASLLAGVATGAAAIVGRWRRRKRRQASQGEA